MEPVIRQFFEQYEKANATSDFATIGTLYADTFMFGGANGVRAIRKEDFLNAIPKMKAHLASMGLSGRQLQGVEASAINAKYFLAKAEWKMTIQNSRGDSKQVDVFATYILERKESGVLSIVFQIDHQDLATVVQGQQNE